MTRPFPAPVWLIACAQLLGHLLTNGRYGIFRDELYYLACADHLAWGYVDHPPLSIAVLTAWRALVGDSVWAIRILPALAGVGLVLAGARLAARFGGGTFAQSLAALAIAAAPGYLAVTGFYSMNAFDLLFWAVAYLLLDGILQRGMDRVGFGRWLVLGLVVGLGLMNKLSVVVLGVGLVAGLALGPGWRVVKTRGSWLAIGTSALVFLPHVLWQIQNDWPTREFIRNAKQYKIADISVTGFLGQNALDMLPNSALLWLAGLIALLAWSRLRARRWVGVSFLAVALFLIAQQSKPYYLYPAFLPLFAAGAVAWEALSGPGRWRWIRPVWIVSLALGGLFAAPMAIPVLSPARLVAYQQAIGLTPSNAERSGLAELSQHLADRFGWKELTDAVHRVYRALPAAERSNCLIVTDNYGEAGALTYFGRSMGLPGATSQHNNYFLWGPGLDDPDVVIAVGMDEDDLRGVFEEVRVAERVTADYAMPFERDLPITVCRGWKVPLAEAWRRGRSFI